jgi:demethylmenaquinone methyltransferase/2-methoxy-6-polyprenyl-1,4-benzoquinol methylase
MKDKINSNSYNITDIFQTVSNAKYDLMNDVMSFGVHRLWKKYFVDQLQSRHKKNEKVLDIASGTGDIFNLLPQSQNLFALDPIASMHEISKQKNNHKKINYQVGYAEKLPYPKNFFQTISCTYGVRNFDNRKTAFKEIFRCLKKKGIFLFMEFGMPKNELLLKPYMLFLEKFLPFSGSVIAKDRHSYKYLADSIKQFPAQEIIHQELENAGFLNLETIDFLSGANSIYIVQKK